MKFRFIRIDSPEARSVFSDKLRRTQSIYILFLIDSILLKYATSLAKSILYLPNFQIQDPQRKSYRKVHHVVKLLFGLKISFSFRNILL